MAALTFSEPQALVEPKAKKKSFLQIFFDAIVDARMAEARMQVNAHLLSLDDETLAKSGIDRAEISALGYRSSPF
ncbi:unnamed protein product [Laminaria digitata]